MFFLPTLNLILALCSLVLALAAVALYIDYFLFNGTFFAKKIKDVILPAILSVTIGSVALSLVYSEYFGFVPCSLCWLQRIAIYPQALLAVLAVRLRDHAHFPLYGIGLSLCGLIVAVYQYIYQFLPKETVSSGFVPCLVDSIDANCAVKVIDEFGFVTFPFISAVTFAFLIIVYLYLLRSTKNNP